MSEQKIVYNLRDLTERGVLMDNSRNIINDNFRKLFRVIQNIDPSESDVKNILYDAQTNIITIVYFDETSVDINLNSELTWQPL